jgi:hypothetical protein
MAIWCGAVQDSNMRKKIMKAKLVRVKIEEGKTGLFFATSPELKGLLVAEATVQEIYEVIPAAIADLYAAGGEKIIVSPVAKDDEIFKDCHLWVAIPTGAVQRAIDARYSEQSAV